MALLDLPVEILLLLPAHLHDLRALISLKSTCRALHVALEQTLPNTILRLAVQSDPRLLKAKRTRPSTHTLALAVAGQVSDWAIGNISRTERLQRAFLQGSRGILMLGLEMAGLSLAELRVLCGDGRRSRNMSSTLDRVVACIAQCHGDREDRVMLRSTGMAADMVYHMAIYGELFKSTRLACLNPEAKHARFSADVRQAYLMKWPALSEATPTLAPFLKLLSLPEIDAGPRSDMTAEDATSETLGKIFRRELVSLASNQAWQMKWRTALHGAGILSKQSTPEEDLFWITTMQSCGLAGLDAWSTMQSSRAVRCDNLEAGKWIEERRIMVEGIRRSSRQVRDRALLTSNEDDWPDIFEDLRLVQAMQRSDSG
ncbi:uncharacterized protein B0I36DRAFT_330693 [Microdochium trichocladiopsis]|uniref:F-box domain-containing protein n=1 Tax=Microdochium trichocladiopsis TaxID=1682393 RepID=A0A9P8Y2Q2_9PEZI|nr:uncharacterized protein B0I36DRAFT_330693 [Microdochium trichocladiopsis]KAH7026459.1 hypothetical protein B0I36DRAFT_330693 [Microdochium trichocladiopsis]